MSVSLIRYDAARKALAAAHRVDEVKRIHDKATALLAYARQAGDLTLQNQAAEIRILSERRAGQLLVEMHQTGQRQGKERGRPKKVSSSTTLPTLGITRDQSSKWQRLARMVDDATFEEALLHAKDRYGELTTAGVLRAVKDLSRPATPDIEPDINVVAADLIREIESASRRGRLEDVVQLRARLNPTIRKKLIAALENSVDHTMISARTLASDLPQYPATGKAHQRVVREMMAEQPEVDLEEKRRLAKDFTHATVREISYAEAKDLILANEWLGSMGSTEWAYGLFFGTHLAGVVCFGSTAGNQVAASVCGSEHKHKVVTLCRGACRFWAHPHSASYLITAACKAMTKKGYHVFVAYSDPDGAEIGSVYQASGWAYCSTTSPTQQFRSRDGKVHDSRQVSGLARDRRGGTLKYKRTRAEQKQLLIEQGCEFFEGTAKHRYVGIFGDRRTKRVLRQALRWEVLPYPKRQQTEVAASPSAATPITRAAAMGAQV